MSETPAIQPADPEAIQAAAHLLNCSLRSGDPTSVEAALAGLREIITVLGAVKPSLLRQALRPEATALPPSRQDVIVAVRTLLGLIESANDGRSIQALYWLLDLNAPQWSRGGEFFDHAVPVAEVAEKAFGVIDGAFADYCSAGAILLGTYGDEAEPYLAELIERCDRYWQDCFRAPGITWALYQIGGLRPDVRERIIRAATDPKACPHSRSVALRILRMNQIDVE